MNINDIITLKEQEDRETNKINRSAFLYMDPKDPVDDFAQCSTCYNWLPTKRLCKYFSKEDEILGSMSCGLYAHGIPTDKQPIIDAVTPEDAGLVSDSVRCENCSWFSNGECGLFKLLMARLPDEFDLDPAVDAKGCCNAWQKA